MREFGYAASMAYCIFLKGPVCLSNYNYTMDYRQCTSVENYYGLHVIRISKQTLSNLNALFDSLSLLTYYTQC